MNKFNTKEWDVTLQDWILNDPIFTLHILENTMLGNTAAIKDEMVKLVQMIDDKSFISNCINCGKVADYVTFNDEDCWIQPYCLECDNGSKANNKEVTIINSYFDALRAVAKEKKFNKLILRQYIVLKGLQWNNGKK